MNATIWLRERAPIGVIERSQRRRDNPSSVLLHLLMRFEMKTKIGDAMDCRAPFKGSQ